VNVQASYTIVGAGQTRIEVRYAGSIAGSLDVAVVDAAPALFPVAQNQDGATNSEVEPAARETVVTFFGTGEGLRRGLNIAGKPAEPPYDPPLLPVSLLVAGVAAELLYTGPAPGLAGLAQINARVPGGFVPPGPATVELQVGNAVSPPITVWLK